MDFDKDIVQRICPNYTKATITPRLIVIHWTAGSYRSCINWFMNPTAQVSAHFLVKADGTEVSQFVPLPMKAWHAGGKSWHPFTGEVSLNSATIGIELEGPPSMLKLDKWGDAQMETLAGLCKWIAGKCPSIRGITDHSTIAPTRKLDVLTGKGADLFPWAQLVAATGLPDQATPDIRKDVREHFGMIT